MGTNTISIAQKISGGLSGGFSGTNVPAGTLAQSTQAEMVPASGTASVSPVILAQAPAPGSPTIAEPIAAITGAYLYQMTDLVTGGSAFPWALPFTRSYSSAANTTDTGLGKGWTSNYTITASRSSDPFAGLGESSPAAAAAAIAALYVAQDLMQGTRDAKTVTLAWMVNRWLTDQLTNNAVMIARPDTNESFTVLPRAGGEASARYVAPLGSAALLTGSAPDAYGNFTTFTYLAKDRTLLTFNPVDSTGTGRLAGWRFPYGASVDLAYSGANLTAVTNSLGRGLAFGYSGNRVASVTDETGRSVWLSYDADGNLVRFTDPSGSATTYAYDGPGGRMVRLFHPATPSDPFFTNTYDALGRVSTQADANGNVWQFHFAGSRTETI
ncbi:MAG: RHS repeat protein, partial [Phycisphaerales bacterium]|nr:RHS repeat protein [Phycisphaerales bacterium]